VVSSLVGHVVAVSISASHGLSKQPQDRIQLLAGLGVEGDAHQGATTQHRWLVKKDPTRRNLTQVHLLQEELFDELATTGFSIKAGVVGENITTRGVDLLCLPTGTKLHIKKAVIEVTGLRDPCSQLNKLAPGLMKALIKLDENGRVVRKAGIMGVVLIGGTVRSGDAIHVELPPEPWRNMGPV
jgi:MOSC domain-containing protein YiiM